MRRIGRARHGRPLAAGGAAFILALSLVPRLSSAAPIVFRIFNLGETTAYVVQRNSRVVDTEATSPLGVFSEPIEAIAGDRIVLSPDQDLAPPVPPVTQSAVTQGPGCVHVSWTPTGDMTVVGYEVSYGTFSVERGQTTQYQYTVATGLVSSLDICDLAGNTYYFSVQAINHVGQVSAYSAELSVDLATTPVLISQFEARASGGAVHLTWDIRSDEVIAGFRVYRRSPGLAERLLNEALLPATAASFVDRGVRSGTAYTYTLAAVRGDGREIRSAPATATTPAFAFALEPSMPNPFRDSARIPFALASAARVSIRVYSVTGALVATLFEGTLPEGRHEVSWGGHDLAGNRVAAGTYFCTLTAGKAMRTQKMLLIR